MKVFVVLILSCSALAGASAMAAPKLYPGLEYLGSSGAGRDGAGSGRASAYYASFEEVRWSVAEEACIELTGRAGDLVAIESPTEDAELHVLIRSSNVGKVRENLWTSGAYDSVARVWRWASTGAQFNYTNWDGDKEPDFAPATARVVFNSVDNFNYRWVMRADGEEKHFYICEVAV